MAQRLVVVGGDAAGMAAATNARRRDPRLEIVVIEQGPDTSYSACGIPYVVAGAVDSVDDLVVRTPQEFRDRHRIDVRIRHRATEVDLDRRQVLVRSLDQQRQISVGFDLLHIATGATPLRPPIDGIDQPWVHGVQNLEDARSLVAAAGRGSVRDVVVVGGGYIGLEMAEAFVDRGARVVLVEAAAQPMGTLDPEFGHQVSEVLTRYGVDVRCDTKVTGFDANTVTTERGEIHADLAILGLGVGPASSLGIEAGLAEGAKGAIGVDRRQRTSVEGIYSAGDCADTLHRVTGQRVHIALGTVANKTGRVAGINLGGDYASFPGVVGTAVTRVCATEIARTGITRAEADSAGIAVVEATIEATSRAGYFPGNQPVTAKVLAEKGSRRLVGAQIIGADRVGKHIDTMATAITAGLTLDELVDLDLAYAPPVSPVWDPFQTAARVALGKT